MNVARREALGALAGLGCSAFLACAPVAARTPVLVPIPAVPMRLARRIERRLLGGASLVVERSWQTSFSRQGRGLRIMGEQIVATVQAPAALAPLAEIERARATDDMWPILLSGDGMIVATGGGVRPADLAAAVRAAEEIIAGRETPAAHQAAEMHQLAQLQSAGASLLDQLPDDLFFPSVGPQQLSNRVELPGGQVGEFEVTYVAVCASGGAWLERATRRITTRIGTSEHHAQEEWLLTEM